MLVIKIGDYESLYKDANRVRTEVFCKEQGISAQTEKDELDRNATHVVGYFNNAPIVTARLVNNNGYSIGRVATIKQFRKRGFARLAIEAMLVFAKTQNINEIVVHSQKSAEEFYSKIGFKSFGQPYTEAGIEHISMKITI